MREKIAAFIFVVFLLDMIIGPRYMNFSLLINHRLLGWTSAWPIPYKFKRQDSGADLPIQGIGVTVHNIRPHTWPPTLYRVIGVTQYPATDLTPHLIQGTGVTQYPATYLTPPVQGIGYTQYPATDLTPPSHAGYRNYTISGHRPDPLYRV